MIRYCWLQRRISVHHCLISEKGGGGVFRVSLGYPQTPVKSLGVALCATRDFFQEGGQLTAHSSFQQGTPKGKEAPVGFLPPPTPPRRAPKRWLSSQDPPPPSFLILNCLRRAYSEVAPRLEAAKRRGRWGRRAEPTKKSRRPGGWKEGDRRGQRQAEVSISTLPHPDSRGVGRKLLRPVPEPRCCAFRLRASLVPSHRRLTSTHRRASTKAARPSSLPSMAEPAGWRGGKKGAAGRAG